MTHYAADHTIRFSPLPLACSGEAGYTRLQSSLDWVKSIAGDAICLYEQVNSDRVRLFEKERA